MLLLILRILRILPNQYTYLFLFFLKLYYPSLSQFYLHLYESLRYYNGCLYFIMCDKELFRDSQR